MLHITNGSSANMTLQQADLPGDYLAWDDPLHDGPCLPNLDLDAMSELRANFIASSGWTDAASARRRFAARDARLRQAAGKEEIVLWSSFELYDQMHLMQLTDWLADEAPPGTAAFMVDVRGYLGAGQLTPREARHRYRERVAVSPARIEIGQQAWRAFCGPDPTLLQRAMEADNEALPFLKCALRRMLEEFPDARTGLSRTQRQTLQASDDGTSSVARLFCAAQAQEERRFMGDSSFWLIVAELINSAEPLLTLTKGASFEPPPPGPPSTAFCGLRCELTPAGHAVLAGEQDWLATHKIDRWIGGVNLSPTNDWRWESSQHRIARLG